MKKDIFKDTKLSGISLLTWMKGRQIGTDGFGNLYYEEKFFFGKPQNRKPRRWVVYRGLKEGSKVPPEWHAWLHFTSEQTPDQASAPHYDWIKPYIPNLTGTTRAYKPPVNREATYYQAWRPGQQNDE